MREISLDDDARTLPRDTILVYGDTGTGKTTWSGSCPRPLFLADATEEGWTALKGLGDDQLFEPGVKPIVWGISEMNDMAQAMAKMEPMIASGRVLTVVISSLTFYADLYLAHLIRLYTATDMRKVYGDLGIHLRDLRTRIHALGINVVWEALADHPDAEERKPGRPLIPGKQADKFAAGVSYVFHTRCEEKREQGKISKREFKLYTQPHAGYLARTRISQNRDQLPNPLIGGYSEFLAACGYDVEAVRKGLPPIGVVKPALQPAKPPIQAAKPIAPTSKPVVATPRPTNQVSPKPVVTNK